MAKKKQTVNKSLFIVPIICVILLVWYATTNSVFEKIFIIFILFSTVFPLTCGLMNIMIYSSIPSSKGSNKKKKQYIPKERSAEYICKQWDNNKKSSKAEPKVSPYYSELRRSIINISNEGKMTDYILMNLRPEINALISKDYSNLKFNDIKHEVFKKIKDSGLTDNDYIYLNKYLKRLLENVSNNNRINIACKEITH